MRSLNEIQQQENCNVVKAMRIQDEERLSESDCSAPKGERIGSAKWVSTLYHALPKEKRKRLSLYDLHLMSAAVVRATSEPNKKLTD